MVKKSFNFKKTIDAIDQTDLALKDYYQRWRIGTRKEKAPFIALYNSFKENHLKDLEGGPLKLYLFFAFAADNEYGHSWHSVASIAKFFNAQTRTIDNWIKVLVDKDLIYREQKGKKSNTTYLVPYSNTIISHRITPKTNQSGQEILDAFIKKLKDTNFLYGEIFKVFHFFQWGNINGKPNSETNFQLIFVITKRHNGVLIGHGLRIKTLENLTVNEISIEEPSVFDSPLMYNGVNITGLALEHDIQIQNEANVDALIKVLAILGSIEDWELNDYLKVQYGERDTFSFDEQEGSEKEGEDKEHKNKPRKRLRRKV